MSSLWCRALDRTPAGHQVVYQDDHGHHDQDVNEIATEVTKKSQQPQNQQYHQDCPQHFFTLLRSESPARIRLTSSWQPVYLSFNFHCLKSTAQLPHAEEASPAKQCVIDEHEHHRAHRRHD